VPRSPYTIPSASRIVDGFGLCSARVWGAPENPVSAESAETEALGIGVAR
jgi:hypothetical protein